MSKGSTSSAANAGTGAAIKAGAGKRVPKARAAVKKKPDAQATKPTKTAKSVKPGPVKGRKGAVPKPARSNRRAARNTQPETTATPPVHPQPGPTEVLGQVSWLMMQSPVHKHMFLSDLEWLVLPPVMLKQFRIFRRDGKPVAFASWAYLNEDTAKRLTNGSRRLSPHDWKSGKELWLIDLIAPFGGGDAIIKELCEKVFKGQTVKTLQPASGDESATVVEL